MIRRPMPGKLRCLLACVEHALFVTMVVGEVVELAFTVCQAILKRHERRKPEEEQDDNSDQQQ